MQFAESAAPNDGLKKQPRARRKAGSANLPAAAAAAGHNFKAYLCAIASPGAKLRELFLCCIQRQSSWLHSRRSVLFLFDCQICFQLRLQILTNEAVFCILDQAGAIAQVQAYTTKPTAGDEAEVGADRGQQPSTSPVADISSHET